jgi:hypothetical protein
MQHHDSESSDWYVGADTADDFIAPIPVVEESLDGTSACRRRELWNYTASVHLVGAALAVRPARGMVAAANHVEARERARLAAERLFRASGRVVSVVITRLW